jgi:hypothetical protein
VENPLAKQIMAGQFVEGDTVTITAWIDGSVVLAKVNAHE